MRGFIFMLSKKLFIDFCEVFILIFENYAHFSHVTI